MNTVEQENFATGKFHEFRVQAIRLHEIFANFRKVEVPKLLKAYVPYCIQVILACRKFSRIQGYSRNSRKFHARENLLFYSIKNLENGYTLSGRSRQASQNVMHVKP